MASVQIGTAFDPKLHGFRFVNRFQVPFSVMFPLPFVSPINLDKVIYGLCGGMCFGALDYYRAGKAVPAVNRVDDIENRFLLYLWDRQLDSLRLPAVLRVMEWMLIDDSTVASRVSQREVPKVKRRIDKGSPAVLALIRTKGVSSPTQNHQVMVVGYDYDAESKDLVFQLYDPNHPGKAPTLSMNLTKPSHGLQLSQSTGENLRGFFVLDYNPQRPF
ncbi:MAG TPA: hypothetical protein VJ768_09865 [Anaerolineales bacterium]|nr:hypothetical protein [Anaerolineales bacterium]